MRSLDWLVVGSGPTGLLSVAKVLESSGAVGWIEKGDFITMGRLGERYSSVPANTRNDRLVGAFRALPLLEFDLHNCALAKEPLMATSQLGLSVDFLRRSSSVLRRKHVDKLYCRERTKLISLSRRMSQNDSWKAILENGEEIISERVILATGAQPRGVPRACREEERGADFFLEHDELVVPDRCDSLDLDENGIINQGIAIVGGSHSGMLAARNVLNRWKNAKITVFDKRPEPRFAEERHGWIKYDGTGLKGDVAYWTRTALAENRFQFVQIRDNQQLDLQPFRYATFTCGFERCDLPSVYFAGEPIDLQKVDYDPHTGQIATGLYGVGIAFPEVWVDPGGYREPRVGFANSFVTHLERLLAADDEDRREFTLTCPS